MRLQHSGPMAINDVKCAMLKCNQLNEVVQHKTACSWSLLLLHKTIAVYCGRVKHDMDALHLSSYSI